MAKDDDIVPFSLRLPRKLLLAIAQRAAKQRRSTNSEMVLSLECLIAESEAKTPAGAN